MLYDIIFGSYDKRNHDTLRTKRLKAMIAIQSKAEHEHFKPIVDAGADYDFENGLNNERIVKQYVTKQNTEADVEIISASKDEKEGALMVEKIDKSERFGDFGTVKIDDNNDVIDSDNYVNGFGDDVIDNDDDVNENDNDEADYENEAGLDETINRLIEEDADIDDVDGKILSELDGDNDDGDDDIGDDYDDDEVIVNETGESMERRYNVSVHVNDNVSDKNIQLIDRNDDNNVDYVAVVDDDDENDKLDMEIVKNLENIAQLDINNKLDLDMNRNIDADLTKTKSYVVDGGEDVTIHDETANSVKYEGKNEVNVYKNENVFVGIDNDVNQESDGVIDMLMHGELDADAEYESNRDMSKESTVKSQRRGKTDDMVVAKLVKEEYNKIIKNITDNIGNIQDDGNDIAADNNDELVLGDDDELAVSDNGVNKDATVIGDAEEIIVGEIDESKDKVVLSDGSMLVNSDIGEDEDYDVDKIDNDDKVVVGESVINKISEELRKAANDVGKIEQLKNVGEGKTNDINIHVKLKESDLTNLKEVEKISEAVQQAQHQALKKKSNSLYTDKSIGSNDNPIRANINQIQKAPESNPSLYKKVELPLNEPVIQDKQLTNKDMYNIIDFSKDEIYDQDNVLLLQEFKKYEQLLKFENSADKSFNLQKNAATDLIINTYMRSGSSFLGKIFALRPDTFYVYEPLWHVQKLSFYHGMQQVCHLFQNRCAKQGKPAVQEGIGSSVRFPDVIKFINGILDCQFQNVRDFLPDRQNFEKEFKNTPSWRFAQGQSWNTYLNCAKRPGSSYNTCMKEMKPVCRKQKHKVLKVLRTTLDNLEYLIKTRKNLHIIHMFRDPRGIINSHFHTGFFSNKLQSFSDIENDIKTTCDRMRIDIRIALHLRRVYKDQFLIVQYEDFGNLDYNMKALYNFMHMNISPALSAAIQKLKDPKDHHTGFHPFSYLNSLPWNMVSLVQKHCDGVLEALGYPVFKTKQEMINFKKSSVKLILPYSLSIR
ncbi:sulfotransferase 1 [Mactra antiquata]